MLESTDRIGLLSPACLCQTPPTRPRLFFSLGRYIWLSLKHPPREPSLHLSAMNARSKVPAGLDFFDHLSASFESEVSLCGLWNFCSVSTLRVRLGSCWVVFVMGMCWTCTLFTHSFEGGYVAKGFLSFWPQIGLSCSGDVVCNQSLNVTLNVELWTYRCGKCLPKTVAHHQGEMFWLLLIC